MFLFTLGVYLENFNVNKKKEVNSINHALTNNLEKIKSKQIEVLNYKNLSTVVNNFEINDPQLKNTLGDKIDLLVYDGKKLIFWTNNVMLPTKIHELKDSIYIIYTKIGYYQILVQTIGNKKYILAYQIYKNFPNNNDYFNDGFNSDLPISKYNLQVNSEINFHDSIHYIVVKNVPLINNKIGLEQTVEKYVYLIYLLSFVVFIAFAILVSFKNNLFYFKKFSIYLLFYFLIFNVLFFFNVILKIKNSATLFSSELSTLNDFVPSLGHAFIIELILLTLFLLIYQFVVIYQVQFKCNKINQTIISLIFWLILYFFSIELMPNFVLNSQIVFNFQELSKINYYSLFGAFVIFISFIIQIVITRIIIRVFHTMSNLKHILIIHLIVGLTTFLWLYFIHQSNGFLSLCFLGLGMILSYLIIYPKLLNFSNFLLSIVVFTSFISVTLEQLNSMKEKEERKIFANKFIAQEDVENELKLAQIEEQLIRNDFYNEYYYYNNNDYKELELSYKYTFFKDYINNYDIDFLRFDKNGKDLSDNNIKFEKLNFIYNQSEHKNISHYFLYIKDLNYLGGYLAKYEICPDKNTLGYVFVLMVPKVKSNSYNLGFYFDKKNLSNSQNNYSYAVYQNNELVKSIGSFPFKLKDNTDYNSMEDAVFFEDESHSHLLKKIEFNTFLIVSKKTISLNSKIGAFTFLVMLYLIIALAVLFVVYVLFFVLLVFKSVNNVTKFRIAFINQLRLINIRKLFLEAKIRIAFVALSFLICSVVIYFTVQSVNRNFNERQFDELDKKLTQIINEVQIGIAKGNDRSFKTLIKHLSNNYDVEINYYNKEGNLIQTGNENMYEQGWFLPVINPQAYRELNKNKLYYYKQNEEIGELKYISYYNAIFDEKRNLAGYIHLPYFSKSNDLKREFSNYLGNLINVSTFLIVFTLLLASYVGKGLVKPLKIIINRLAQIKLGSQNKPIEWNQNDEIGQLVDQYNLMLKKLEINTEKLAKSEREGAWKDMAKQVAHEIKNPLTPMKLHLQHLQLAIQREDDNLIPKIKNISQMLIEQIEHLSKMAEEFSSFAKMPISVMEISNLPYLIENSIQLFNLDENVEFEYNTEYQIIQVYVDKDQLQRVFTNIIKNAIQAKDEDAKCIIKIKITLYQEKVIVSFQDNGKGIEDELKPKIFNPNFSTKTSGMGLGLSICKQIIENFNGSISFESQLNIGTTFYVELPIVN